MASLTPHIRLIQPSTALQGMFALQSRSIPGELYRVYGQFASFDFNRQFWIQKVSGGALFKARLENYAQLDLPSFAATLATDLDSDRSHQQLKLYAGNTSGTATEILEDSTVARRYRILFSVG